MKFYKMSLLVLILALLIVSCNNIQHSNNARDVSTTGDYNELLYGKYPEPILISIGENHDVNKSYKELRRSDLKKVTNLNFKKYLFEDGKKYDFSILLEMPNLTCLDMDFGGNIKLEDYSVLKNLTKLEVLYISNVNNDDVKNLAGLTSLKQLSIYDSKDLTSAEFLDNMQQLTYLGLYNVPNFHDYQPLKKLSGLESLSVSNVNNDDAKNIAAITSIKELNIYDSKDLTNIEFLSNMKQLTYLKLNNVPNVHDYQPLKHLMNVKELYLIYSGLTEKDLNSLPEMDSVESLILNDNRIVSLGNFPKMKNLKYLILSYNPLIEVNILPDKTPNLKHLDLRSTKIADLNKLSGVNNIESITLLYTNVKRISPLKEYKNLKFINIIPDDVEDLDAFKDSSVEIMVFDW